MATILNNKKSSGGSPYAYYSVDATSSNRSTSSVDITITVTSNLQYSSSSLGSGSSYGLVGYITLNNTEYSMTLKSTSQSWSGTTKHTATSTFNVNVPGSQSQLTNVKFRVSRTGSAANDYSKGAALSSTSCSNISIGIGHTNPTNVTYTIEETNQNLINAGVGNDTYVNNLSIKKYNISATLHDGAIATDYNIYNGAVPSFNNSTPITIDYSIKELVTWKETGKVPIRVQVIDNMGGNAYSSSADNPALYNYIPYLKISLNESATRVSRVGQLSGRVKLNIKGLFFNGIIGNINQIDYKPTIKYKFWKLGDTEPTTFDNTIPSENISVTNNTFTVNDLEIGSSDETATNHFNPDYAYRVKIYVEDNFTTYTSQEKPIPVGEATWTEYKDRVDFKKITKQGLEILAPKVLYENTSGSNSNITLSDNASNYKYIEIFYKNNDNAFSSVKVYQPNDKKVSLISHDNNARNTAWVKFTLVVIHGNTIQFGNGVEIKLSAGSAITASSGNLNYITRVIGYK